MRVREREREEEEPKINDGRRTQRCPSAAPTNRTGGFSSSFVHVSTNVSLKYLRRSISQLCERHEASVRIVTRTSRSASAAASSNSSFALSRSTRYAQIAYRIGYGHLFVCLFKDDHILTRRWSHCCANEETDCDHVCHRNCCFGPCRRCRPASRTETMLRAKAIIRIPEEACANVD